MTQKDKKQLEEFERRKREENKSEPESVNTLQHGDYFTGTEEQYREAFGLEGKIIPNEHTFKLQDTMFYSVNWKQLFMTTFPHPQLKTELTFSEFIRRTKNTFKGDR